MLPTMDTETPYFYLPDGIFFIDPTDFHPAEIDVYAAADAALDERYSVKNRTLHKLSKQLSS